MSDQADNTIHMSAKHNLYCRDEWDFYRGDGPRGMGPANDGCVCALSPEGYGSGARIVPWQEQKGSTILLPPGFDLSNLPSIASGEAMLGISGEWPLGPIIPLPPAMKIEERFPPIPQPFDPKLWDTPPDSVTHIAGAQLNMFNRYLRQRCDWCGIIIIEYDLERIAVREEDRSLPAMWRVGSLVRIDGYMSAEVEAVEEEIGQFKLPMDSCAFDPKTQVGYRG